MFEKATRMKLRFKTSRGDISVEDLWELPLKNNKGFDLDTVAKGLHRELKDSDDVSFVENTSNHKNLALELKFDIVKYIIKVKLDEKKERELSLSKKERREYLQSLIKEKQDEALKGKSIEDLQKELSELD